MREQAGTKAAECFDFIPRVFSMPEEYHALQEAAAEHPERRWILKPKNASKGKGISLVDDTAAVPLDPKWMVQEYVDNAHLLNGHKYVLRLYALISSVEPLRLYLYREGSAKLASEPYNPDERHNLFAHLTNPDVNILNENIENPVVFLSLEKYRAWLGEQRIDADALFTRIEEMVTLTIIAARETMRTRLRGIKGDSSACYELLGIDCLIDDGLKPRIMECNLSPSLDICAGPESGGDVEEENKRALIHDMLRLLGITSDTPEDLAILDPANRVRRAAQIENERAGGFKRLFPAEDPSRYLSCFPLPRLADVVLAEAVSRSKVERPRLRIRRAEEIITQDGLRLFDQEGATVFKPNESAAWIWLKAAEGEDPDSIAGELWRQVSSGSGRAGTSEWELREQVWTLLADWAAADMLIMRHPHKEPAATLTPFPADAHRRFDRVLATGGRFRRLTVYQRAVLSRIEHAFRPLLADAGAVDSDDETVDGLTVYQSPGGYSLAAGGRVIGEDVSLDRIAPIVADHLHALSGADPSLSQSPVPIRGVAVPAATPQGANPVPCILFVPLPGEDSATTVPESVLKNADAFAGGVRVLPETERTIDAVGLPAFTRNGDAPVLPADKNLSVTSTGGLKAFPASDALAGKTFQVREIRFYHKNHEITASDFDDTLARIITAVVTPPGESLAAGTATRLARWLESLPGQTFRK